MKKGRHSDVYFIGNLAIKIFKPGFEKNASKEYRILKKLKPHNFSPVPYLKFGRIVIMSRLRGIPLKDFLPDEVRRLAIPYLRIMFLLDSLEIMKEENHRPLKHFIITRKGPKLIDFERSHKGTGNVTQFMSYLNRFFPGIIEFGPIYKREMKLKPIIDFISSKKR